MRLLAARLAPIGQHRRLTLGSVHGTVGCTRGAATGKRSPKVLPAETMFRKTRTILLARGGRDRSGESDAIAFSRRWSEAAQHIDLIAQLAAEARVALAPRLETPGHRIEQPGFDRRLFLLAARW